MVSRSRCCSSSCSRSAPRACCSGSSAMEILFHLAIMSGIYMILALSLNLLIGYAGLFSVGHGAFYGLGAYAAAILSTRFGLPFWAEIFAASAAAGLVGY